MLRRHAPSVHRGSERKRIASATQDLLHELKGRQEKLDQGMNALKEQLQHWEQAVEAQVDDAIAKSVLVQKEITTECEISKCCSSSGQDVALQDSMLVLRDQDSCPLDTDC